MVRTTMLSALQSWLELQFLPQRLRKPPRTALTHIGIASRHNR
jgi:hypothetical protein